MIYLMALLSGLVVTLLEAVCTGQVYLPVLAYIAPNSYWPMLLWYNLMFILPLLIIVIFFYQGASSKQIESWYKKHWRFAKLSLALVFILLAILLLEGIC